MSLSSRFLFENSSRWTLYYQPANLLFQLCSGIQKLMWYTYAVSILVRSSVRVIESFTVCYPSPKWKCISKMLQTMLYKNDERSNHNWYRQISHIRRNKSQSLNDSRLVLHLSLPNLLKTGIVENEDVVGAAPTGDAPTTSEWSTI